MELRYTGAATRVFHLAVEHSWSLWAPDLVFAEVLSALRRLVRTESITASAGARASAALARLPIAATGTREIVEDIWALRRDVGAYDACYVALARRLASPLVTADRRLARMMAARRWQVVSLAKE